MRYFVNSAFTVRNPAVTNLVACAGEARPSDCYGGLPWEEAGPDAIEGLDLLWLQGGVEFYGHL